MLLKKNILLCIVPYFLFFSCQAAAASNVGEPNKTAPVVDPYASEDPYNKAFDSHSTDASKRILHAPTFDLSTIRDPFISYIDQKIKRQHELDQINKRQLQDAADAAKGKLNSRPKEPLEDKDLTELKLVAIFSIGDRKIAMVEDTEGKGSIVKVGAYMGKNNGRIVSIDEASLTLLEKRLNSAGDIVDHEEVFALSKQH